MKWMVATLVVLLLAGCGSGSRSDSSRDDKGKGQQPGQHDNGSGTDGDGQSGDDGSGGETPDDGDISPVYAGIESEQQTLLEQSLDSGVVVEGVEFKQLLRVALNQLELDQHKFDAMQKALQIDGISWQLPTSAARLGTRFGHSAPVLVSNRAQNSEDTGNNRHAVFAAVSGQDTHRQLILGANPMASAGQDFNAALNKWLRSSLVWLAKRDSADRAPLSIVLAHLDENEDFATRTWLSSYFDGSTYNSAKQCDGEKLAACVTPGVDVLVLSQHGGVSQTKHVLAAIEQAQQQGTGILYLQQGAPNDIGAAVLDVLQLDYAGGNEDAGYRIEDLDMTPLIGTLPLAETSIQKMVQTLLNNNVEFDFSRCKEGDCSGVPDFYDQFWNGAQTLRAQLKQNDADNDFIFEGEVSGWLPWLVLAGDAARQAVRYPMDRVHTAEQDFLRAMFADVSVYYSRMQAFAAPDLGVFSRNDFSHITPTSQSLEFASRQPFRAAGVYVLPGQRVSITRVDQSPTVVTAFVNSVNDTATRWWYGRNQYNRPRFLKSAEIRLEPRKTVQLVSPYGGPLQLGFSDNGSQVKVLVENIGQHPFWNSKEDSSVFFGALRNDDYDWAELSTPYFEIHSRRDEMQSSVKDWSFVPHDLAEAVNRYSDRMPYLLAGYQGEGIEKREEVHSFALQLGIDLPTRRYVQHMNADQASCGWGCPGNPYDANWHFSPISHGDLHQLGRSLASPRFRFEGWGEHMATNLYSYYSKYRYYLDSGKDPECQALPFREFFNAIVSAQQTDDPMAAVQHKQLTRWTHGAAVYLQLMMAAQSQGALLDGWMLLPRLHLLEHQYQHAISSNRRWLEQREALGFGSIPWSIVDSIGANDWLIVSMSLALGRDVRSFLALYGISSANELVQRSVSAMTLPPLQLRVYASGSQDYCKGLQHAALAVDGSSNWPTD